MYCAIRVHRVQSLGAEACEPASLAVARRPQVRVSVGNVAALVTNTFAATTPASECIEDVGLVLLAGGAYLFENRSVDFLQPCRAVRSITHAEVKVGQAVRQEEDVSLRRVNRAHLAAREECL